MICTQCSAAITGAGVSHGNRAWCKTSQCFKCAECGSPLTVAAFYEETPGSATTRLLCASCGPDRCDGCGGVAADSEQLAAVGDLQYHTVGGAFEWV